MSDTVTINRSAFIALPQKGKGAIDLLRTLQSQIGESFTNLNAEQQAFVNNEKSPENTAMKMAARLGWTKMPPIIGTEDSLRAEETGIILKRGNVETKYPYSQFVMMPKAKEKADEFVLVIDAGHGGHDPGSTYPPQLKEGDPNLKLKEEDITLSLAQKVKAKLLGRKGIKVLMTREEDKYVPLSDRTEFANAAEADLFASFHVNSFPNEEVQGFQVYTQSPDSYKKPEEKSKQLPRLAKSTIAQQFIDDYLGTTISRGNRSDNMPTANFQVLRDTKMPSVLLESGFITNPEERAKLQDEEYQDLIATQFCRALDQYIRVTCKN